MIETRWAPLRSGHVGSLGRRALGILALALPGMIGAAGSWSAPAYGLEGKPIGGPCGICGKWIPAGQTCSCWTRKGGGTGGTGGTLDPQPPPPPPTPPKGPTPEEIARQKARDEALGLNEAGVGHYNSRRWQQAIDAFAAALAKWPDNQTMRTNLANARVALAGDQLRESSDKAAAEVRRIIAEGQLGDLEALDRQVRELDRSQTADWTRQLAAQARERADFQKARQAAMARMGPAPDPGQSARLPWEAGISNPQIARVMRGLRAIEVPPPLPAREISMSWKSLTAEHGPGVLEKGGEFGFLAWDLLAKPGGGTPLHCKALLIAGKTFIAGEDGAYVHLVKQDRIYEQALAYLKDPATNRRFAELVRDLKETGQAPASADAGMLQAARAIADPALGSSGVRLAWDAMLSPEARAAMVRKACLEVGAELMGQGTEGLLRDLTKQRSLYEAASRERRQAQQLLKHTADQLERDQLMKVIAHANHVTGRMYRLERSGPSLGSYVIGKVGGPEISEPDRRQP